MTSLERLPSMNRAVVAGLGIQGVAIAYGMKELGYQVLGIDISPGNIRSAVELLSRLGTEIETIVSDILTLFERGDAGSRSTTNVIEYGPDVLISALPFNLNYDLASLCIRHGVRYCDLGGNIDTSDRINALAREEARMPVMTDLGLAPGIANIIGELGYRRLGRADSVKIMVGGLPTKPAGSLKYGLTFSPQGLYNEYREDCLVIRDGAKAVVEPLTEVETLHFEGVGELEAFHTSGGISNTLDTMLSRGVSECSYKTLRFPGHVELVRSLLFERKLDLVAFSKAVINACGFIEDDQVLIDISVRDDRGEREWSLRCRVLHDGSFTAMQKTTGLGTAAVAAILGSGVLDDRRSVMYADIPTDDFVRNMRTVLPEIDLGG
jgi:lysine 6-dehydrogenase